MQRCSRCEARHGSSRRLVLRPSVPVSPTTVPGSVLTSGGKRRNPRRLTWWSATNPVVACRMQVLCMNYTSEDARTYIASVRWQFASTMPEIPHWYTVRKWRPELEGAFVAFVRHIRSVGIRMDWPDPPAKPFYHNQYLLLDGWKYWTLGDPHPGLVPTTETPETTTLINRARIRASG